MMQRIRRIGFGLFTTLAIGTAAMVGLAGPAPAADERLEVSGIKAVRTTLVDTQAALQKADFGKAKGPCDPYDWAGNESEVYTDPRTKRMYEKIELDLQA